MDSHLIEIHFLLLVENYILMKYRQSKSMKYTFLKDYDIVIWSATNMKWIEEKMKVLGCDNHPDYKLAFYLDSRAMISIHADKYGVIEVSS